MICAQADVILNELPPPEEDRHHLLKRIGLSNLDLRRTETFLWGGKYYHITSSEKMLNIPKGATKVSDFSGI